MVDDAGCDDLVRHRHPTGLEDGPDLLEEYRQAVSQRFPRHRRETNPPGASAAADSNTARNAARNPACNIKGFATVVDGKVAEAEGEGQLPFATQHTPALSA